MTRNINAMKTFYLLFTSKLSLIFLIFFGFAHFSFAQQNKDIKKTYAKLRFSKLLNLEEQKNLQKQGIQLVEYLQNNTYLVCAEPNMIYEQLLKNRIFKHYNTSLVQNYDEDVTNEIAPNLKDFLSEQEIEVQVVVPAGIEKEYITEIIRQNQLQITKFYPEINLLQLKGLQKNIVKLAKTQDWIQYIDVPSVPTLLNNLGKNNAASSTLDFGLRNLTGKGINIGIWDGSTTGARHIDFNNRFIFGEPMSDYAPTHGLHVTGTMAGAGNRYPQARGMAAEANIIAHTLNTGEYITYEMFRAVQNHGITITQNSYGESFIACPTGSIYNVNDRTRDQLVNTFPELLHVFAIGNSQTYCFNDHGNAYGSTAGNCGKNTITVGAVTENDVMTNFSSWGPTRDGRIKPDITAIGGYNIYSTQAFDNYGSAGWSGTSMAAPVVSGVAAQLQQRYKQLFGNVNPPASLLKAVMCNGARDLGNPNPDYTFGFGRINALASVLTLEQNRFVVDKVSQGVTKTYTFTVPAGVPQVKVLIAWSDVAAIPTVGVALINNLNLQVSDGVTTYNPWVLDPANRSAVATRGIDNLNNIEQVTIATPIAGTYSVTVTGAAVPMGEQEFALTWEAETPYIRVVFPSGNNYLTANSNYTTQWDTNITTGTFDVEYSLDNGGTWATVATGIAPTTLQQTLASGATFTNQALIRVKNGAFSGTSEQNFTVMPETSNIAITPINNGGNVTWNAVAGATGYDVMLFDPVTGIWTVAQTNVPTNSTTLTNLVNGKTYWVSVKVRAGTLVGERAYANPFVPNGAGNATDLSLQSIIAPISATCSQKTATEDVTITIRNNGTALIPTGTSIPLSYKIDTQPTVNENLVLTSDLLTGATINYTFTQKANLSANTTFTLLTSVSLATDLIAGNNSATSQIKNALLPLPNIAGTLNLCAGSTTLTATTPVNNYAISTVPFAPQSVAGGTTLSLGDEDVSAALPIGFPFKFFDNTYNNVFVAANGIMGFTQFGLEYASTVYPVPSANFMPQNFIAFAWADLNQAAGGTITYKQSGVTPNRKFIIDFNAVPFFATPAVSVTVQVILNENNTIEIHATNIPTGGVLKTMGLENENGTLGFAVAGRNNTSWAATNEGTLFTPKTTGLQWQPNSETTQSINVTTAGNYTVSYTAGACTFSKTVTVATCDVTPPQITAFAPTNNATNVAVNTTLTATFDEPIQAGTGTITISDGVSATIINVPSANIIIVGNVLTVTLPSNLGIAKQYYVNISATAIRDIAPTPNNFAGISGTTTWRFTTFNPTPPPPPIVRKSQVITVETPTIQTYAKNLSFAALAKASSDLPLTYKIISGKAAMFSNQNTVFVYGAGQITVEFSQVGNQFWFPATPVQMTYTINKASQFMVMDSIADKVWTDQSFALSVAASSGLPVSVNIPTNNATYRNGSVILQGKVGLVTVEAWQEGNDDFLPTTVVKRSFTVGKIAQTVTIADLGYLQFGQNQKQIIAKASSNLPLTLTLVGKKTVLNGTTLTFNGAEIFTIKATQEGNEYYFPASAERNFTVAKQAQSISFEAISNKIIGFTPFAPQAKATSNLPVSFELISSIAQINNNLISANNSGTVTIKAMQNGNEDYEAASTVFQSFEVLPKIEMNSLTKTNYCSGDNIAVSASITGAYGVSNLTGFYLTPENGNLDKSYFLGAIASATLANGTFQIPLNVPDGKYIVRAITTSPKDETPIGNSTVINIAKTPEMPTIIQTNEGLVSNVSGNWFVDNVALASNTNKITPLKSGVYTVKVSNGNCEISSQGLKITVEIVTGTEDDLQKNLLKIYPNPTTQKITVEMTNCENLQLELFDILGKKVYEYAEKGIISNFTHEIDLGNLASGVYQLKVQDKNGMQVKKVVKR